MRKIFIGFFVLIGSQAFAEMKLNCTMTSRSGQYVNKVVKISKNTDVGHNISFGNKIVLCNRKFEHTTNQNELVCKFYHYSRLADVAEHVGRISVPLDSIILNQKVISTDIRFNMIGSKTRLECTAIELDNP